MLEFAINVAREAGALLRDKLGTSIEVNLKGDINLVTEVDLASERLIREAIATHYPRHQILGEEGGLVETASDYRWVVDPLDGTTNYAHGYPVFAVSIALEHQGEIVLGVVYDPMRDELFAAERGSGASLNNRAIRVSSTGDLMRSLVSTGFPYDIKTSRLTNLDHWANFAMNAQALRRDGAASLASGSATGDANGGSASRVEIGSGCGATTTGGGAATTAGGAEERGACWTGCGRRAATFSRP